MFDTARSLPFPVRTPVRAWVELFKARHLVWSPYTLPVPGLPPKLDGLRLLQLTDLHGTHAWMPAYDALLARVAADPPDLILITGDFVDSKHDCRPALPTVERLLNGLRSRLGIYAILGNHDGDTLPVYARDWPVRLLHNQTLLLRDGDTKVELVGLYGVEPADATRRFLQALGPKPPETLRVVLSHYPSQVGVFARGQIDLFFAGHTHGGQVCLPGGWPPITHEPAPRRFARGVHWLGDRWMIVGRGLGFSTYRVRSFCPPEVIEVKLVPKGSSSVDALIG